MHVITQDGILWRTLPSPIPPGQRHRLQGVRLAGPDPLLQPRLAVQRKVSSRGGIQVARQRIQVGFSHSGQIVTIELSDTALRVIDQHGELIATVGVDPPGQGGCRLPAVCLAAMLHIKDQHHDLIVVDLVKDSPVTGPDSPGSRIADQLRGLSGPRILAAFGGEPACRPGSVRPLARGGGHPSGTAVAGSLVRSTREHRAGRPRSLAQGTTGSPLDLAPGGVYQAAAVTCGAGGLLHRRFTLTPL